MKGMIEEARIMDAKVDSTRKLTTLTALETAIYAYFRPERTELGWNKHLQSVRNMTCNDIGEYGLIRVDRCVKQIQIVRPLPSMTPKIVVYVACENPWNTIIHGEFRSHLEDELKDYDIGSNISFLGAITELSHGIEDVTLVLDRCKVIPRDYSHD